MHYTGLAQSGVAKTYLELPKNKALNKYLKNKQKTHKKNARTCLNNELKKPNIDNQPIQTPQVRSISPKNSMKRSPLDQTSQPATIAMEPKGTAMTSAERPASVRALSRRLGLERS